MIFFGIFICSSDAILRSFVIFVQMQALDLIQRLNFFSCFFVALVEQFHLAPLTFRVTHVSSESQLAMFTDCGSFHSMERVEVS